jgi:hypothetical protein
MQIKWLIFIVTLNGQVIRTHSRIQISLSSNIFLLEPFIVVKSALFKLLVPLLLPKEYPCVGTHTEYLDTLSQAYFDVCLIQQLTH